MKTIAQLISHRDAIAQAFQLIKAGIPSHLVEEVSRRVAVHDSDKFHSISTANEVEYAAHDFTHDHHVAYWVIHGGNITDGAFIEHVCDHIAVNLNADRDVIFDFAWFYSQQAFARDSHFGNSKEVSILMEQAKFKYAAKCSAYSELLAWINSKFGEGANV